MARHRHITYPPVKHKHVASPNHCPKAGHRHLPTWQAKASFKPRSNYFGPAASPQAGHRHRASHRLQMTRHRHFQATVRHKHVASLAESTKARLRHLTLYMARNRPITSPTAKL